MLRLRQIQHDIVERPVYSRAGVLLMAAFAGLVLFFFMALTHNAVAATLPQVASAAGREMDRQIASRLGMEEGPVKGLSLTMTTPVDVNNLELANPLARQMQEELTRWFVQAGYDVQEVRKGREVLFEPEKGETLLTRKQDLLGSSKIDTHAIVAGTYTVTPEHVRFNIKIVKTCDRSVLAMSTLTINMNREVAFLARSGGAGLAGGTPIEPTVVTLLP